MLDFAVNVRAAAPPPWLAQRLSARIGDLGRYPSREDETAGGRSGGRAARPQRRRGRAAGGRCRGVRAAGQSGPAAGGADRTVFHRTRRGAVGGRRAVLPCGAADPFELAGIAVPEAADLVIVGNPTNPTSVLHSRESILALRRPGRIVVVDEAFADAVPGEPESLAGAAFDDVVVLRSLTKTWGLAGLRVGYALGSPDVLSRLTARRAHWPLALCRWRPSPRAARPPRWPRRRSMRDGWLWCGPTMVAGLRSLGLTSPTGWHRSSCSRSRTRIAYETDWPTRESRFADATPSSAWTGHHLRAAVRPEWHVLVEAIAELLP